MIECLHDVFSAHAEVVRPGRDHQHECSSILRARGGSSTATRLIDRITIPAILHDPTGTIPGAWTGSIADLNDIKWHDTEAIREALRAVVEISDTSSYKAMTSEAKDITSNSSILCRYKVVENASRFYDQRLGLIPVKES